MTSAVVDQPLMAKGWTWQCQECARECVPIRAESRCMCGHRLKEHADGQKCTSRSCSCPCFKFIVAEGSWILRCRCKHKHTEHDPCSTACKKTNCSCTGFCSPWVCNCDHPWAQHQQVMVEKQVLRITDMMARAQHASDEDCSRGINPADNVQAAAAVATGEHSGHSGTAGSPNKTPSSIARLQQLQCLRQQQRQQQEPAPSAGAAGQGGAVPDTAVACSHDSVCGAEVLVVEGDLSCEVNRWDLVQRGKP